jgi:glucokinase
MGNREQQYVIGIDLGGTKIELGIVDDEGRIYDRERLDTPVQEGPAAVEREILKNIDILRKRSGLPLSGVGIGVAGQIQWGTGLVIFAPNLQWHRFPLQANIEKALNIPTCIVNDVRAIAFGEWLYGAGKGSRDLLCVFVGTGIGGCLISNGKLMTGCSNTFGEVGHMTIDFKGPKCTCGKRGCFEAFAGGWGIAARAKEAIEKDKQGKASQCLLKLADGKLEAVTAKILMEAYRQKDPMAEMLIEEVQKALIAGFASLVNLYNPCRLIIGGGVIDGMPEMIQKIDKGIREMALQASSQSLEVRKAQLGKEVGVIGSAAAIFNKLKEKEAYE